MTLVLLLSLLLAPACKSGSSQKKGSSTKKATSEKPDSEEDAGPSAQELFAAGNKHLDERDWEAAVDAYRSALEKNAERWDVHLNLAIALSEMGKFNEALDAIEGSLAKGGDEQPEVYFNLGNIYQERGLYRQAVKAYRTSLAHREETDLDTLVNIAAALTILGEKSKAKSTYEKAQKLAPQDPRIQHGFAVLLHLEGEHKKSIDAYQQLHSMAPDYAAGYFDEASPHVEIEDFRGAIDALQRYLEVAPDGPYAQKAKKLIDIYREQAESSSPQ